MPSEIIIKRRASWDYKTNQVVTSQTLNFRCDRAANARTQEWKSNWILSRLYSMCSQCVLFYLLFWWLQHLSGMRLDSYTVAHELPLVDYFEYWNNDDNKYYFTFLFKWHCKDCVNLKDRSAIIKPTSWKTHALWLLLKTNKWQLLWSGSHLNNTQLTCRTNI